MKLEIQSFNGKLFKSDTVVSLTAVSSSWEITILEHHVPLITALTPSVLKVVYKDLNHISQTEFFAIGGWVLEVANNTMRVLIDMLVTVDEVNLDLAEKAKNSALQTMEAFKDSKDRVDMEKFVEAQDMLLKSLAQLKLWNLK